jgi:hypothetical protein
MVCSDAYARLPDSAGFRIIAGEAARFTDNLADAAHLVEPVIVQPVTLSGPADDPVLLHGCGCCGGYSVHPKHAALFVLSRAGILRRAQHPWMTDLELSEVFGGGGFGDPAN